MLFRVRILPFILTPLMAIMPVWAESPYSTPQPSANDTEGSTLEVRLIQNDDSALVNTASIKGFTVEVTNAQGTPVAGAAVAFRLPDAGPTGTFAGGSHSLVVYTDALGRASATGIQWGVATGVAEMRVTAAKGSLHAGLLVSTSLVSGNEPASAQPALAILGVPPDNRAIQQPGVIAGPIAKQSDAAQVAKIGAPAQTGASAEEPVVSITNAQGGGGTTGASGNSNNKKKWVIIAAVGVGLGVGAALALNHGGGAPPAAAGVTIGSPSISLGH